MTQNIFVFCEYCQTTKLGKRESPDQPYACVTCGGVKTSPAPVSGRKADSVRSRKRKRERKT